MCLFKKKTVKRDESQSSQPPLQSNQADEAAERKTNALSAPEVMYDAYARQDDNKTARLMELIGNAIEEWSKEYHLENLPKSIVFQQALDAMHAMEPIFVANSKNRKPR